jgi:histone demethylase JARID1
VRTRYEPEKGVEWLKDIPPCPQYFPTEEEWNNGDPLEYINKIRPEAEKFGLANIVPPKSWQPEFCLPNKEFMRFRTRIQAVNELQNRPAGLGKRARMKEAGGDGEWREDGVGGADDNRRSSGAVCWTHGWRCTCNNEQ